MDRIDKFLDLNRSMAKMANKPRAMPNSILTVFNRIQTRKIIIPIRKKENTYPSLLEYL
jgi:hypothetical protein